MLLLLIYYFVSRAKRLYLCIDLQILWFFVCNIWRKKMWRQYEHFIFNYIKSIKRNMFLAWNLEAKSNLRVARVVCCSVKKLLRRGTNLHKRTSSLCEISKHSHALLVARRSSLVLRPSSLAEVSHTHKA